MEKKDGRIFLSRRQFLKGTGLVGAAGVFFPGDVARFGLDVLTALAEKHPLTAEEEKKLIQASYSFLAPTMEEAIQVAREINFIPSNNNEWVDNMCGPLAVFQLMTAGLLPDSTDVGEFWLINPRVDQWLLERTFPRGEYEWFQTKMALADFDFIDDIFPGDIIYSFGGSFEHFLVVNRMNEMGRVFAVTNLATGGQWRGKSEFTIRETLLFDPLSPGTGQFYDWKYGRDKLTLGLTGTAGFARWRRKRTGEGAVEVGDGVFSSSLKELLSNSGGEWHAIIRDISGVGDKKVFAMDEKTMIHPASVIKIPIAMLFFAWADGQSEGLKKVLASGTEGRSFEQLLRAMIVKSEEPATETLRKFLEKNLSGGSQKYLADWKVGDINLSPRQTSVLAMTDLFEYLYRGKFISEQAKEKILAWMGEYTGTEDDKRLGAIKNKMKLPRGWRVNFFNKRGSIAQPITVVADAAIIEFLGPNNTKKVFVAEFFGYPGKGATYDVLEKTLTQAAERLANAVVSGEI